MNEQVRAQPSYAAAHDDGSLTGSPSAVWLIVLRELGHYLQTRSGYIIGACFLLIAGLLFNLKAFGNSPRYSQDVLADAFYFIGGCTAAAANFFTMRLFAEERQTGTLVLLRTSPLTESQLVFAKYFSALLFLVIFMALTTYMPALVFYRGNVSLGHVACGYLGVLFLGSAVTAIGTFTSAIANSQIVAIVLSAVITVTLLLLWIAARFVDGPLGDIISHLALWDKHFTPFMEGTVSTASVLYYVSVTVFFLFLARLGLESRRWRS